MKTIKHRAAAAALAATVLTFTSAVPSLAEEAKACAERSDIVSKLDSGFTEKRQAIGLMNDGNLLEVFVSQNGTWTVVLSTPKGWSCVVSSGEAWHLDKAHLGPDV